MRGDGGGPGLLVGTSPAAASSAPPPAAGAVVESTAVHKAQLPDGTKLLNGLRVLQKIGEGAYAKVKLCEGPLPGNPGSDHTYQFALKVFRKGRLRRQRTYGSGRAHGGQPGEPMKVRSSLDKVHEEIQIMRRLNHSSCVRLFAIYDQPDVEGKLYLVIEYASRGVTMEWDAGNSRYFDPSTNAALSENVSQCYVRDALSGLHYLHGLRVCHRDLKPQNLLVFAEWRVKLADFGVATDMQEDFRVVGTEGTYHFYSPEMCASGYESHDGRRADVWALGVTLWAFLFGSVPFLATDMMKLLDAIAEAKFELPPASASLSGHCRRTLLRMLCPDPAQRPLAPELLEEVAAAPWGGAEEPARRGVPQVELPEGLNPEVLSWTLEEALRKGLVTWSYPAT